MLGRVYKITCTLATHDAKPYIGSTQRTIIERLNTHISAVRGYSLTDLLDLYGRDNFTITLLAEYTVCDLPHLRAYEQLWMNRFDTCNKNHAFNPCAAQDEKRRLDARYREHREAHIANVRARYQSLPSNDCGCGSKVKGTMRRHRKSKKHQRWAAEHPEHEDAPQLQRVRNHSNSIVECECGSMLKHSSLRGHLLTKKHERLMFKLQN